MVQLHGAPVVVLLLGIDGRKLLLRLTQIGGVIHVHLLHKVALLVGVDIGLGGFLHAGPGVTALHQGLEGLGGIGHLQGGHAVLLGHIVEEAHQDIFGRANMALFLAVLGVDVAVRDVVFTAFCDAGGGAAVHGGLPDVVLVVQQHGALPFQPAGQAAGFLHHGVVVVLLPEAHARGQHAGLPGRYVIDLPALLRKIPPDYVLGQGRQAHAVEAAFGHFHLSFRAVDAHGHRVLVVPLRFHGVHGAHLQVVRAVTAVALGVAH